jgi:hypothetical protein
MAAAFEAVDAHGVAADRFGLQRVAHRGAFVDDLDAGFLERGKPLLRIVSRRLDDLDAAVDDRPDIAGIVGRRDGRQESKIDTERPVGHFAAATDLAGQRLRRALRQAGDDAEPAGRRHRRRQLGEADIVHAALDDRVLDLEHFGDFGLHGLALLRLPLWSQGGLVLEILAELVLLVLEGITLHAV